WPESLDQDGTSDLDPGSVARSSSRSPGPTSFSALCNATSGPGHDWPRASTVAVMTSIKVLLCERSMELVGCGVRCLGRRLAAVAGHPETAASVGDHCPHETTAACPDHCNCKCYRGDGKAATPRIPVGLLW